MTSSYVHSLFAIILIRQILEKSKSLTAESRSRTQCYPKITSGNKLLVRGMNIWWGGVYWGGTRFWQGRNKQMFGYWGELPTYPSTLSPTLLKNLLPLLFLCLCKSTQQWLFSHVWRKTHLKNLLLPNYLIISLSFKKNHLNYLIGCIFKKNAFPIIESPFSGSLLHCVSLKKS